MTFAGTGWSLLPPLLAIGLAIATKRVYLSLGLGVVAGAFLANGLDPVTTVTALATKHALSPFREPDNLLLLAFSFLIGATVQLMQDSGGTAGMVRGLVRFATSRAKAQVFAGLAGVAIFFDDYANCLMIGPAFRAVFAHYRISRAKLAFIVDSTAAADASLWFVSTWIGFEVSVIAKALAATPGPATDGFTAYGLFLTTIPYRFYILFITALVFIIALTGRDFGPMVESEKKARKIPPPNLTVARSKPHIWAAAVVPMLVLLVGTLIALWLSGRNKLAGAGTLATASIGDIIGAASSNRSMFQSSVASFLVAVVLAGWLGRMRPAALAKSALVGMKIMAPPLLILVFAWALGDLCLALGTGPWVGARLMGATPPWFLPTAVFLIGAAISFATGTAFGTMAILIPVAIPLVASCAATAGFDAAQSQHLMITTVGCVLAGSLWGDHCSIISDTLIMSATGARCDLYEHYATQMPYATLAGAASILCGTLPVGLGVSPWICIPAGIALMWIAVRLLGVRVR